MLLRLSSLSLVLLSTACASITTGTTQTMSVVTEPPGAICMVGRAGETVGIINPTPGSVTVGRSSAALTIRCERPGYQVGFVTVPPSFQVMTIGNLLLGGVVGIVVDAASGAINQYPPNVALAMAVLPPPPAPPPPMVMEPIPDEVPPARSPRRGRPGV